MPSKMLCPLQCHPVTRGTLTSLRMQVPRSFPGMNSVTSIICTKHMNMVKLANCDMMTAPHGLLEAHKVASHAQG